MRCFWSNGVALLLAVTALSCGAGGPPPSPSPSPPRPRAEAIPLVHPARYLVPDAAWIERTSDGIDRVVINGRRMEVRGVETTLLGPAEPEVSGGAMAPSWVGSGPCRYVFWKGKELSCAERFTGELHKIATLPAEPVRAFDWLEGTGIIVPGGAIVVPVSGGAPATAAANLSVAAVINALAADARRAVVATALGHVLLTVDGGKSFRDASAELGPASTLLVRGSDLVVVKNEGRGESLINASGGIADARGRAGIRRGEPPPDVTDLWPNGAESALRAAVRGGLPLPDGGAVITARGIVGRLDLATLRTTSTATLEGVAPNADCHAFRAADATLLACANRERASVVDISGAPRLERTFDLAGGHERDRFVGFDGEALGYLGACDGQPAKAPRAEGRFGGDFYDGPPPRSAVFCVRASRDEWVEHRLDPGDAGDVLAWIPRPGGGAVAIVARMGTVMPDAERVAVRGGLRVVRVARNEPPFTIQQYGYHSPVVLNRGLHVRADDVIEGWLPASMGSQSMVSVTIDAAGRARAYAGPPRANHLITAGKMAIAQGDDGRLFETVDAGHHWAEIEPPPGAPLAAPSQCSPVGCQVGAFVRIGWSGREANDKALDPTPSRGRAARERERGSYAGRQTAPPLVRLACSFDGPAEGKRTAEAYGFGATAWPQPRGSMPMRLGALGVAMFPWNGPQPVTSGDVDLAWVSPLDLTGRIRRTTISLGHAGVDAGTHRVYEVKLAYIVDAAGGLDVVATGHRDACMSSLLDVTGVTRSLGGCAEDPAIGVDLGGKVVVIHAAYDALVTSAADAPPRRKSAAPAEEGATAAARGGKGFGKPEAKGAGPAPAKGTAPAPRAAPMLPPIPVALRELAKTPLGVSARGFSYGAGVRDGAPWVVAVDQSGAAFLAPIDPERGTLGAEEPLRALTAVALGSDASCAGSRPAEARVVLPFDNEIGLDRASLRGVVATGLSGIAVLRWSRDRACLDAVELSVRDERFDADLGPYEPQGTLRKLIARFTGAGVKAKGEATLLLISNGMELRQPAVCNGISARTGEPDAP